MYRQHQKNYRLKPWLIGPIFKPLKTLLQKFLLTVRQSRGLTVLMLRLKAYTGQLLVNTDSGEKTRRAV
jgi:hypothetical protein